MTDEEIRKAVSDNIDQLRPWRDRALECVKEVEALTARLQEALTDFKSCRFVPNMWDDTSDAWFDGHKRVQAIAAELADAIDTVEYENRGSTVTCSLWSLPGEVRVHLGSEYSAVVGVAKSDDDYDRIGCEAAYRLQLEIERQLEAA